MEKLRIHIPSLCQEEIKYSFHCLLTKFLGIQLEFISSENDSYYLIEGKNGKNLKIENHFFHSSDPKEIYKTSKIPSAPNSKKIQVLNEGFEHLCLFGNPEIELNPNEILLKSDLIASSYFMLSRWEEWVYEGKLDRHERFPLEASIAHKFNFYHRPIVNEYLELLIRLLEELDYSISSTRSYSAVISYDIDMIQKWRGFKSFFQSIYLNLKSREIGRIINDKLNYFGNLVGFQKDPFFSFDFILDSLEGKKIKAILYFKSGISHPKYDKNIYKVSDSNLKEVFQKLQKENIGIGLHPSYHTFNTKEKMAQEFDALQSAIPPLKLQYCRQHYLRFSLPETWRIMDEIGFKNDSSFVYSKEAGFRCGVCYTFPVFDCENRKMLSLEESPLIFMETPLVENEEKIIEQVERLTQTIKKYNGENIILWHNNNLHYKKHRRSYKRVLEIIQPD